MVATYGMGRLIEAQDVASLPRPLMLAVGDVLRFYAFGGRIVSDSGVGGTSPVRLLGPFVQAVIGATGRVISPEGSPSSLLILAQSAGTASIRVNVGDPWGQHNEVTVEVVVQG